MQAPTIPLLMVGPLPGPLQDQLDQRFIVHRFWKIDDKPAWFAEHGSSIRAVATSAVYGAKRELLDQLPSLEIISSFGVGLDAIDVGAAQERNIIVAHTPGVLTNCVADAALGLLLDVTRRISEADRFVRAGGWLKDRFPVATSLYGKRCGIVGMGAIGQAIATRAAAFGMDISYYGPRRKANVSYTYVESLVELARQSDFLILALPGGGDTHHVINGDVLDALGPKGFLVNIARGSVVDEPALVERLLAGKLAGAGLDVFEDEPRAPQALFALDNVVLLPHVGSGTKETREAMAQLVYDNLDAWLQGKPTLTSAWNR